VAWASQPMDSQGRRIRVFDTPLVSGLNALAAVVGLIALLFATALYMLTFLPGDIGLGSAEFAPFFALVFPLWFGMFYALGSRGALRRRGTRRFDISAGLQSQLRMFRLMPRAGYVVVPIFVILGVFGFESAFHRLAGQPEYHAVGHHYYLDDHGLLIAVSRTTYLHDLALQSRLFLGVSLVFISIATMMAFGEWARRRRLRKDQTAQWGGSEPWPGPVEPRPPYVMRAGTLFVVLLLAGAGAGLGGGLIVVHLQSYFGNAKLIPDHGSVRLSLPAGHYVVFLRCPNSVCAETAPSMLHVRSSAGTDVHVTNDPSSDRLSEQDETYEGVFSLDMQRPGIALFVLRANPGLRFLLDQSNGEAAIAVLPWIGPTVVGLLLLIWAVVDRVRWFRWRYWIGETLPVSLAEAVLPSWPV
jgi:hypothetical protein